MKKYPFSAERVVRMKLMPGQRTLCSSFARWLPCLGLAAACVLRGADQPDIVLADFENGYGKWQVSGEAFNHPTTRILPASPPTGFSGKGLADSWDADHQILAGTLTSPEFTIERPYIRFLIGGRGSNPENSLQLLVDGKLEYYACGAGDRVLRPIAFDVSSFIGHKARLVISDTGKWNSVAVDDVIESQSPGTAARVLHARSECVPVDKEMDLAGMRYLEVPINNMAQLVPCELVIDGQPVVDLGLRLAIDASVDFWAAYPLPEVKGRKLRLLSHQPVVFKPHAAAFERLIGLAKEPRGEAGVSHEASRPQLHFTPKRGQNNDPNGLFYYEGVWHVFYQHNPMGMEGGNQCWGHATSPDLFHWTEQPIAIPKGLHWQAFSGSGVVDLHNVSGLRQGPEAPILLFHSQNGRSATALAYSTDGGNTFRQYAKNPLFLTRHQWGHDPKVVRYEREHKWVMAIHDLKDDVWGFDFYESTNLLNWSYMSTSPGWWETPDLFPLPLDGNTNRMKWVLQECGHTYKVGDFDGHRFVPETEKLMSFYGDYLAPQTFNNAPDGRCVMIAATSSFAYYKDNPGLPLLGGLSLPAEVTLRTSPSGPRLYLNPVREIEQLAGARHRFQTIVLPKLAGKLAEMKPDLFDIEFAFSVTNKGSFCLSIWGREAFSFDGAKGTYAFCGQTRKLPPVQAQFKVRLIADRSICTFYLNDGYEAGSRYLAGFTPEHKQALALSGGEQFVFDCFRVTSLRPPNFDISLAASSTIQRTNFQSALTPEKLAGQGHYNQPLRPQFHYTPIQGHFGDATGLIINGGEYHLFHMYDEWDLQRRDHKRWGHAISTDLVHWKQMPGILDTVRDNHPGSGGGCVDWNNSSGLQQGTNKTLLVFYTDYGRGTCVSYSTDGGRTWNYYGRNPVLPDAKNGKRDPLVFWHEPTRKWSMLRFEQPGFAVYNSDDLIHWNYLSLIKDPSHTTDLNECPDLFELPVENRPGVSKWVLVDGNGQYFIGQFNGTNFAFKSPRQTVISGNFYATQTWKKPGCRPVQVAWQRYEFNPITESLTWNGECAFPCELRLVDFGGQLALCREPIPALKSLYAPSRQVALTNLYLKPGDNPLQGLRADPCELVFDIKRISGSGFKVEIGAATLDFDAANRTLNVLGKKLKIPGSGESLHLRILVDRSSLEIFADHGRACLNRTCFPLGGASHQLAISPAPGGALELDRLEVNYLSSIWK